MEDSPAIVATDEQLGQIFHGMNQIENLVSKVVTDIIPASSDDQLEQIIIYANGMERGAFIVRGAAIAEIQARIGKRLKGGRGHKDDLQRGVSAELNKVASRIGMAYSTLQEDSRIFRILGPDILEDADPLDRRVYIQVSIFKEKEDRDKALALARSKREDPTYNTRQFEADCKAMRDGVEAKVLEDTRWITVGITEQEYAFVKNRSKKWDCNFSHVISYYLKNGMRREGIKDG